MSEGLLYDEKVVKILKTYRLGQIVNSQSISILVVTNPTFHLVVATLAKR